jgi:hypothetical protein
VRQDCLARHLEVMGLQAGVYTVRIAMMEGRIGRTNRTVL